MMLGTGADAVVSRANIIAGVLRAHSVNDELMMALHVMRVVGADAGIVVLPEHLRLRLATRLAWQVHGLARLGADL